MFNYASPIKQAAGPRLASKGATHIAAILRRGLFLLAACILSALAASAAVAQESCELGVPVGFKGSACTTETFTLNLGGTVATGSGFCTTQSWINTPEVYKKLIPNRTYQLTAGSGSCSTQIKFNVPEGYELEIDDRKTKTISKGDGNVGSGDGTWKVVLREKCDCDGEDGTEPGSGAARLGSVIWEASLGLLPDGRSAESLGIREEFLSSAIYTPSALTYAPPVRTGDVEVIRGGDGNLRQVKAPQALADVSVISGSEYDVRFYRPEDLGEKAGGVYVLTGQPFLTWKVKNPDPATTQRLQISKIQDGLTVTSEYTWDSSANSWSLSTGNGARVETKTNITEQGTGDRIETTVIKDGGGAVASKVSKTYHNYNWGEELIREVEDPDGAALTTVYTYYTSSSEAGRYRKVKTVTRADGSWEKYDYDVNGNQTLLTRPWKDLSLAESTESNSHLTKYFYTNNDGIELSLFATHLDSTEEWIAGVRVGRTTYDRAGSSVAGQPVVTETITSYSSSAVGEVAAATTTYHQSASASLAGRTISSTQPGGRKTTYLYERGNFTPSEDPSQSEFIPAPAGLAERETVVHGTATSPGGIAFKTTKETAVRDARGRTLLRETFVYTGAGYERIGWRSFTYDGRGNLTVTLNHKGEVSTASWVGDRKTSEKDGLGVEAVYSYDALGRILTRTKKGIAAGGGFAAQADIVTTYSYDAAGRVTGETINGGGLSLASSTAYDAAGRVKSQTSPAQLTVTHGYAASGRIHTVTMPGGASRVSERYLDGQAKSETGAAVVARRYDYGVETDGRRWSQEFVGGAGLNSPRRRKTTSDWLGRAVRVESPTFISGATLVQTSVYNIEGQLQSETTKSGTSTMVADALYEYDELGERAKAGSDVDASGTLTANSSDRIVETATAYEKSGPDWFRVATVKTHLPGATATTTTQKVRLNNFATAGSERMISESTVIDVAGNQTKSTTSLDRSAKKLTVKTDAPDSTTDAVSVAVNGLIQSATPATPESATTFAYDALGRDTATTNPRTGSTTKTYDPMTGLLISVSHGPNATNFEYYAASNAGAGRLKVQTNPAGKKIHFSYTGRGELQRTWGDATYPVEYVYDDLGQKAEMHTFRGGSGWGGDTWPSAPGVADVTAWIYHAPTGLLEKEQDAAGKQVVYSYDLLGRLRTRAWARTDAGGNAITTTYSHDPETGELNGIDYSDSTPDVTFGYDNVGRMDSIVDAAGTHTFSYNDAGQVEAEQVAGGVLDGVRIGFGYDPMRRRQALQITRGPATLLSQNYGYDASSRLATVTSGSASATYSYDPAGGFLNLTTFAGGASVSRSFDALGRLESVINQSAAGQPSRYTYAYNSLGQRHRLTREDGAYWSYAYNDRGEVVSGKKFWPDNVPVAGQQSEYDYDGIGNRKSVKAGGDALGAGLRQSTYYSTPLNQYVQRTVPGVVSVAGVAAAGSNVTVNDEAVYRRGEYFHKELTVANGNAPVYLQLKVMGVSNNATPGGDDLISEEGGHAYVPKFFEVYEHDADGNLTRDGRWQYTWDAENRLTSMEALPVVPAGAKMRLEFAYDHAGRRIRKRVFGWDAPSSAYQLQSTTKFVYDGWNLVAELDGGDALVRRYVWGQDASGGLQGAGGVGGLLFISEGGVTYQVGYDGNGNLTSLFKAGAGTVAALYEYDPFGQMVVSTGDYSEKNPFGFSTKYADRETGLLYYGLRYYNPQTGRWVSRDPSGEVGGLNLHAFVNNDGVNAYDFLGLWKREGEWSGAWYRYSAIAVAEACDDLSALARLVTGDENNWKLLSASGKVREGQRVDVSPLLKFMEDKLRYNAAAATRGLNTGFPVGTRETDPWAVSSNLGSPASESLLRFFGEKPQGYLGCDDAANATVLKGLMDVTGTDLYNKVLGSVGNNYLSLFKHRYGRIGSMLIGDIGWLPNYPDYNSLPRPANFESENSVKVGRNRFFGHPLGYFSKQQLESELRKRYIEAGGTPPSSRIPGFRDELDVRIDFLNVGKVGGILFDIRKANR